MVVAARLASRWRLIDRRGSVAVFGDMDQLSTALGTAAAGSGTGRVTLDRTSSFGPKACARPPAIANFGFIAISKPSALVMHVRSLGCGNDILRIDSRDEARDVLGHCHREE